MLRLTAKCQPRSQCTFTKAYLKTFSRRASSSKHHGRKTSILSLVGVGGVAVGAGLVASLLYSHRHRESLVVRIQEAGCREKDSRGRKDAFVDAPRRRGGSGEVGLQEAVRRSKDLLRRTRDEVGSPGIVAAVSVNGKLLWAEGFGYADVENRLPCTTNSVLRIASISKPFTMTAVAKLWEEGMLDLDKPIQYYVPEFPEKEVDGEKVDITTRQLVSHLAGIRHYSKDYIKKLGNRSDKDSTSKPAKDNKDSKTPANDDDGNNNSKSEDEFKTKEKKGEGGDSHQEQEFNVTQDYPSVVDALEMFKDDPLMHKPGSKFSYTTHGWTLVSAIVDAAADQDFLVYMKKIFKDLGMPHTMPDEAKPLIYNRARGYKKNKKGRLVNTPAVNLSHKWAGGGFLSDVQDLIQFGNAMLYSYQYTNKHRDAGLPPGYLKPETMKSIWSPVPLTKCSWDSGGSYAMGWGVCEKGERIGNCPDRHHMISHTGAAVGASSVLLVVNRNEPVTVVNKSEQVQSGGGKDGVVKPNGISNGSTTAADGNKGEVLPPKDSSSLPQGVVVAIIVNLEDVPLYKTAVEIAEVFQKVNGSL